MTSFSYQLFATGCRFTRLPLLCLFILLLASPIFAVDHAPAGEEGVVKPEEAEQALSLIEVYTWSNSLPRELLNLQNRVEDIFGPRNFEIRLSELAKEVDELEWEITMARSNPDLTFHQLSSLDSGLTKIKLRLELLANPIESSVRRLEKLYRDWLNKNKLLQRLRLDIENNPELHSSLPTIDSLEQVIEKGKQLIENRIRPILLTGKQIGEIQTRVYTLNDIVTHLVRETSDLRTQQTSPSMFSGEFYKRYNRPLVEKGWQNLRLFAGYQWQYLQENLYPVCIGLALILFLALSIRLSKRLVMASSMWYEFACRPLASAIFMSSASFAIVETLPIGLHLPPQWESLLLLPMIIAVAMLTDTVCSTSWQSTLLERICLFLALSHLLVAVNLPQPLFFLLVFCSSILGFFLYLYHFGRRWQKQATKKLTWAIWLWGLFPLTVISMGITGHDQLANTFFVQVLAIVVVSLMLWLIVLMLSGLLDMVLLNFPLALVSRNAASIVKQSFPIIVLLHGILWLLLTLIILRVYPSVDIAFNAITQTKLTFYSLTITPASVLVVLLVIYLTVLLSRGIRAFLLQEVLPRYGAEIGAQLSITRLVHYAILTISFFILLKLFGFSLSNLTILGGALGVGIGFGLQAIVNNFVSGLILLFERPVKVGDMIAVGDEVGEVKKLGLRATVVATFDNAEIVIPNSELITTSVTNWTLAEKRVRVKVPVGVAYGSDISKVLEILLASADSNPRVLTQPKPQALFLTFGASSLDFELRAWIPDFSDRLSVRSELNQDIEAEFHLAGIEIPFPQNDLHLRTVDAEAASVLRAAANPNFS